MKKEPRRRKVYAYRGRQRNMFHTRHRFRSVLSVLLTILIILLLVAAGYFAAGPLSRLWHKWRGSEDSAPEPSRMVTEDSSLPEVTSVPQTTTAVPPDVSTETTTAQFTTTAVPTADIGLKSYTYVGYCLGEDALKSTFALDAALMNGSSCA